ncbi:MAG: DUF4465 domain-containing protein [Prevotella sp.]|nr:DUF4465 domain-containing protein [Prevotella sp.]
MKQNAFKQHLWLLLLLMLMPLGAWADREVNQPQFGKQEITVATDEVITFYDPWGTADIVDNNSYNAQSLTVFKPAVAGQSVQVTFETLDLEQFNNSYYLYLNVYDGVADADDSFTWAASTNDVTSTASLSALSGTLLAEKINNDSKLALPAVYTSSTADGALSVGFMHRNSNQCAGWVAKVKCVTLADMTITGAGSSYDAVAASPSTRQNVALAQAYVTAEGVMNPDNVTGIGFKLTQNEGMVDPTALKLYKGDVLLSATVSADGDDYLFTLNEAPADGTTTFTVRGDILGTAAVGAKVQVDITKVTTAGQPAGIAPFTAAASVTVQNPAIVLMTATPQTVTVGETPLQFYDEGGKNGGILSKTNGQVTFLSGDADKKVMVDFTKNEIWHGTLNNQELRIYNGTEVNEANRIKTLQQGETGIVRSTAEDGSLTVVLFSDAGNDVAANGFEATVSLFTPQAMDFNGAPAVAVVEATQTVAGGDTDQELLTVNVKAQNTEPAMQVTKMTFSTGEKYQLVTKASLYFGTTKVGEATPAASEFAITLDHPQPLTEGDNIFTLKYDISDEAVNDEEIIAAAVSVTALVNDSEKTQAVEENAPEATPTVKNLVLSHADQGSVTKTVNGSMAFETKTTSEYSTRYEYGTDTRTNIFIPKHEGMICQIDFSAFDVYYSSSSYGSKAKFAIYAGQGTTGELLWELNDASLQKTGPGKTIRSTAADGALTIVFSPNTSSSYYTGDGWKATVSEYQSKPMTVNAVEVAQASTADASIGATGQDLLTVNVKTEGDQNALLLSAMTLNLKGTEANISKVSVWQGDTQLGEAAAAAEVTISISEPVTLAEGDNLFTVKADVKSNATENSTIDAKVVSITAGTAIEATAGDPDGQRTLKNQVLMTTGSHGTLNLELGQTIRIFDDGGPEGDGADGVEATITIAPTGDAESIKLICQDIKLSYTAYLYIYEGTEVSDEKLIIDNRGASKPFAPIIVDGPVTIKYVGKGSYTKPNFAIQAEGYKKSDVTITSVTTEDISVNEVLKGQTDVKMLKIKVEAKGELTPAEITAFNITGTDGEAVDNYHIYQTGTATTFSPVNVFNGSYSITESGTYYFWLTYDVKAEAKVGQTASVAVTGVVVNGNTINVTEPATATFTVASGKSGTYTIGQGGYYATIQGAIDDIGDLGMDGPVTLKIKAGEYNEKVRIPNIKGLGATNTLTLESESGQRDVKIFHNNYTTGGYSDDQHKKDYGVVTLYEASYVTLRSLDISTTDKAYKAVVMVKDQSRHVTIDDCYLHAPVCTATGEDVCLVGHTIIDEENKNNDYLTVRNCLLEGGKMGVSMGGTSFVALPKEVGGVIEGNTFRNNGQKAIYVMDELGVKIRNNTITVESSVVTKTSVGILDMQLRDEYAVATEITGNVFNVAPTAYCAVMNLRQMEGSASAPVVVANNVINLTSFSASYSALKFNSNKVKNVRVANNTIRMTGTSGGAAFWLSSTLADGYGNIDVVNNIIQNETDGYAVNLYNDGNLGTDKVNFRNNLMWTEGTAFFRAAAATTGGFDTFVQKTGATDCVNKKVAFVSDDILEPENTLDGDLLKAVSLSYVTTDVNGTPRPQENSSIGAYEYDADRTRVPVVADGYPKAVATAYDEAMVTVKADMNGKAYIMVLPAAETAPTAETLKADGSVLTLTKDAEAAWTATGLSEDTEYVVYVLVESTRGNSTEVLTAPAFTTPREPVELLVECTEAVTTVAEGDPADLKVTVSSGVAPFTVSWMDSGHRQVGKTVTTDLMNEDIVLTVTPEASGDYYVIVTDAQDFEARDTCRVIVTGEAMVADFENLYIDANSYWRGPDTKGNIEEGVYGDQQYQGSFVSGSYAFSNNYSIDWNSWSGFAYSNRTSTAGSNIMADQWNSCVGRGVNRSRNYGVFFEDAHAPMTVTVLNREDGDDIKGFYITNAAVTVNAILNGDGMTGEKDADGNSVGGDVGFRKGDYLRLIITGDNGNSVRYYLADYRSVRKADRYYVDKWEWVDLTSLGTVSELTFHLEASRKNAWGYTTPLYFCMDDLNGERPETQADETLVVTDGELTQSLDDLLASVTSGKATVSYELADVPEDISAEVSIDDDDNLVISGNESETFNIVIKVTQAGHTEYVVVPVEIVVTDGIGTLTNGKLTGERYDLNGRRVEAPHKGVTIVRMTDGTVRKVVVK